jgi:hypothetical protein
LPADAWEAFQLDLAAWTLGRWVESKLSERDSKGKPKHKLTTLLHDGDGPLPGVALAIDMAQVRTVHIREDGTWDD